MSKFYTAKKTINGTEYTAQFNGISAALEAFDNSYADNSDNTSILKLGKYIFENVIVSPKVDIDDFESMEEFNEVVRFGSDVMQGKFRNTTDESAAERKSRK